MTLEAQAEWASSQPAWIPCGLQVSVRGGLGNSGALLVLADSLLCADSQFGDPLLFTWVTSMPRPPPSQ